MQAESKRILPLLVLTASFSLAACQQEAEAPAEDATETAATEPSTPSFSVNRQMVSLIDNESHVLWNAEQEGAAPQSEADWNTIEDHALQIYAAGHMLLSGGSGPEDAEWSGQPEWQTHARSLMAAAMAAASAAESKNLDALITANGQLVESCESCHEAFKPDLPTEGRMHEHSEEATAPAA